MQIYTIIFRHIPKISKIDYYLRHFCQCVRLCAWNNSGTTARNVMIFFV